MEKTAGIRRRHASATAAAVIALVLSTASMLAGGDTATNINVFPEQLQWRSSPSIPATIQLAKVYGDPALPGPFVFRARLAAGTRLLPHRHPDERWVTVLSGTYRSAVGATYDPDAITEYPTGSFYVTGPNLPHYSHAKTDALIQEQGIGPTGIEYVSAADDPRNAR